MKNGISPDYLPPGASENKEKIVGGRVCAPEAPRCADGKKVPVVSPCAGRIPNLSATVVAADASGLRRIGDGVLGRASATPSSPSTMRRA